jgi:hypothetical protein
MSLGIVFKGPEGIVLAADSRVTLTAQMPVPMSSDKIFLPATYDNATKLLRVAKHDYVGTITYGLGAIGQKEVRTAHSLIPEFEHDLGGQDRLSVEDFAKKLSEFFMHQWNDRMPSDYTSSANPDMVFLVGGYDADAAYGRVFEIDVPRKPKPLELKANDFGIIWGGQREFTDRLLQGFDGSLPTLVTKFASLTPEKEEELRTHLATKLAVPIPYPFLPLQDSVDLAIFLIRTTITIQNWIVGLRGVGGAIDVATVTRTEGFKPIQQKTITGERLAFRL